MLSNECLTLNNRTPGHPMVHSCHHNNTSGCVLGGCSWTLRGEAVDGMLCWRQINEVCVFFIKFSTSVLLKEPLKTNGSFIKTYCVWVASPFLPLPLPLCSTMLWSHLHHLWKCNDWNNGNLLCLWLKFPCLQFTPDLSPLKSFCTPPTALMCLSS